MNSFIEFILFSAYALKTLDLFWVAGVCVCVRVCIKSSKVKSGSGFIAVNEAIVIYFSSLRSKCPERNVCNTNMKFKNK